MKWESVAVSVNPWYALEVTIQPIAREPLEYALMEAGSAGTQFEEISEDQARVTAYFSALPQREQIRREVAESLRIYGLSSSSVRKMRVYEVENEDWLSQWKKTWQPVEVGDRFLIAPPWSEVVDAGERIVIRIEPGMAFGTGTHETTRLCLKAIEKYFEGGSFLDVGTGTGILAIAAAKMYPDAAIAAFDNDVDAIAIARENAAQNKVGGIDFCVGSISGTTPSASLVCANLTAPVILELLPTLIGTTCGRLVLSGLLDSQAELIAARLSELGINDVVETSRDGEWVAVVV
ncbi:MAG TPA: 50S ribosomal protein L11 methyltransferase [Pyrinomonadaceae bacterium]|nr:50S ribosomal protein L11 methyltransferase [Pyrinomonadaceae bacterium]